MALTVSHRGGHSVLPIARALLSPGVRHPWKHVVVHRNDHRNEYERVVDEMQLDPWNPDLTDARRHRAPEPVLMRLRLVKQDEVLEVVPELDPESGHPPLVRRTGESFAEHPERDDHHQSEAVEPRFKG